ncbi:hypothetical protein J8L98_17440 [Pseudoalteromonas sp. MMG013]|uniref:hypothetical protein n=1 Tax=Pseudoalteromonas sp. MMG013 TaxID=2822687 RepID=UPI001B389921|nr:hypothetical protein [Pseudoalteromonas sp. MMG013]MBQ4863470.1 hypothetical protein [Pseudoalteromonas sp. MMG013]
MYAQKEKPKENKSRSVANFAVQKRDYGDQGVGFVDNRSKTIVQRVSENIRSPAGLIPIQLTPKEDLKGYLQSKGVEETKADELTNNSDSVDDLLWIKDWGNNHAVERHMSSLTANDLDNRREVDKGGTGKDVSNNAAPLNHEGVSSKFVSDKLFRETLEKSISDLNTAAASQYDLILTQVSTARGDTTNINMALPADRDKIDASYNALKDLDLLGTRPEKNRLWKKGNVHKGNKTIAIHPYESYKINQTYADAIGKGRKTNEDPIIDVDLKGTESWINESVGLRKIVLDWGNGNNTEKLKEKDVGKYTKMEKNNLVLKSHYPTTTETASVEHKMG